MGRDTYELPLESMLGALSAVGGLDDVAMARAVLEGAGKLASEVWAPTNYIGHTSDPKLVKGRGDKYNRVTTSSVLRNALKVFKKAGYVAPMAPEDQGGVDMPWAMALPVMEAFNSANLALSLHPTLTQGAIEAVDEHAPPALKAKYLRKLVTGQYSATMLLTEPHAGTDLQRITTKALKQDDGSYNIEGAKIFITWGEHSTTSNILHLVLAKTEAGIGLFLVPKFLTSDAGKVVGRNGIECASLFDEKDGIHASPTCEMILGGDKGPAVGYLIGKEGEGLRCMFTMMNRARLMVGLQGVAISERALQAALSYANERRQGRNVVTGENPTSIINHPRIQQTVVVAQARIQAARMLCYAAGVDLDKAKQKDIAADNRLSLFTPMIKAGCTHMAQGITVDCMQSAGGAGYMQESGFPQFCSDAHILAIYEGENGIQALDLVARKLALRGAQPGEVMKNWIHEARTLIGAWDGVEESAISRETLVALESFEKTTDFLLENGVTSVEALMGATDYLHMFHNVAGAVMMVKSVMVEDVGPQTAALADVYCRHVLPESEIYAKRVLKGAASLQAAAEFIVPRP